LGGYSPLPQENFVFFKSNPAFFTQAIMHKKLIWNPAFVFERRA
jgi:hypothetical protein